MYLSKPIFTIDAEDWNHGLHIDKNGHTSIQSLFWLLQILDRYNVKPIIFMLGLFWYENKIICENIKKDYFVGTHGLYHIRGEKADRQPYAFLGLCGGFYFRVLPYQFVKSQVYKEGQFYCHPHDFDEEHPKLKNPLINWKRHVGLKTSRKKLERLLKEVEFEDPISS